MVSAARRRPTPAEAVTNPASAASVSIGEVISQLRPEFPDVTISKIRFLEEQGLVRPARTASGYRKFRPTDVDRLRFILGCQRDHYLPLRVIREHLEAVDRGAAPPRLPGGAVLGPRPVPDDAEPARSPHSGAAGSQPLRELRLSRGELLERSGIADALLSALEAHGVIVPRAGRAGAGSTAAGHAGSGSAAAEYDGHALAVAQAAGQLAAFGIEPRHLRGFRSAADREAGLVEQVVAPIRRHPGAEAAAKAEETAREVGRLCLQLHGALVQAALERRS